MRDGLGDAEVPHAGEAICPPMVIVPKVSAETLSRNVPEVAVP